MQAVEQASIETGLQNLTVKAEESIPKYVKYVIIGGGISAMQAALILAQHNQDFVLLEASDRIGGRICTLTIGKAVDQYCYDSNFAWLQNESIRKIPIECGATWLSEDQPFMRHFINNYKLHLYPQNQIGQHLLALDQDKYLHLESLGEYYNSHSDKILKLFQTIKKYTDRIHELSQIRKQDQLTEQQNQELNYIFQTYDTLSAFQFLRSQVQDEELAKLLAKQIQTLQSVNCNKFTAIQLFTSNQQSSLANIRFYIGQQNANIDGFRVQQGLTELIFRLKQDIQSKFNEHGTNKNIQDIIKLKTPVKQVLNHQSPVEVITQNGQNYSCDKAIICLPAATIGRIKFSSLSEGKRLIIEHQLTGNCTRMAMIFEQPWWRPQNTGYASFSHKFPMNQLVDLTPNDQSVGIIAFVFLADGFEIWNQQVLSECGNLQGQDLKRKWYEVNKRKSMKILADVYLHGDEENDYLKEVAIFPKTLSQNPYIKSTYDATTAPGVYKEIFKRGLDTNQAHQGEEKNIVILGSDFSDQHNGYMEGAVRIARKKIYALLGKPDPLQYLKNL